jgi:hypothetical protein
MPDLGDLQLLRELERAELRRLEAAPARPRPAQHPAR